MKNIYLFILISILFACSNREESIKGLPAKAQEKGSLFIIGGGKRGEAMIDRLVNEANLRNEGYIYILPMASELGDSAIIWASEQFWKADIDEVYGYNFTSADDMTAGRMDSVLHASLIYISGGDQSRFMDIVRNSPLEKVLHQAYSDGAVIAGTSAGAAIMSRYMITGNELRHPEYYSTFEHLEKNNIELDTGMAFLEKVIIDQHFVKRSRYNRLITAVAEYPDYLGVGIDEATAILVKNDSAEVVGVSQVVTFENRGSKQNYEGTKIGVRDLELNIYLPGEKFKIRN